MNLREIRFNHLSSDLSGREGQPKKASLPIFVTDSGMEMLVRLEQPQKASSPTFVTDSGMEMLVRLEQP